MVLSNLSLAYQQLGQWPQATTAINSSLKLLQTPQHGGGSKEQLKILALALNTQGSLQLALGQSQHALDTWEHAAATYKKAGALTGFIGSRLNQAQALQALGLYFQAKDTLEQVSQTLEKEPNDLLKVAGLRSLGNALRVVGELEKSEKVLQQSLAIAEQLRSPDDIGDALLSLGNLARTQSKTQSALAFYQRAATASLSPSVKFQAQLNQLSLLVENQQVDNTKVLWPQIKSALATLPASRSGVYLRINFAQSLTRLRQASVDNNPSWLEIYQILATAAEQAKDLGDQRAQAYALGHLGGIYEQNQQWANAKDLTQQALILAQAINAPDIGYRWQWQLGRLLKAQGDINGAIASYTEAVENLKSLRNNLVGVNPDIQFSFRDQVEPVYRQLVDLLLQGQEPSQENLVQARSVIESLQLAELNNFFQAACLEEKAVDLDQVIDRQDPTAAVIYPIILADRVAVILKLPKTPGLRYYETTVAQGEVEKLIKNLTKKLAEPDTFLETQSLSRQVYDWLVRPAELDLARSKVKTLVFVLDTELRNIPMSSLYDGQQYLVGKYASALSPGLQLLTPKSIKQVKLNALTGGINKVNKDFMDFPALENVGVELARIKSELPGRELLNEKFTRENLHREISSAPFSIVHLATHGQFSSQADKTFLLAWDGRILINELSTILQSRENSMPTAIELLVLSACETAQGDNRAALGLAGVAVRAGARSTLASLWTVQDKSTATFMSQFYQNLVDGHMTKAEALRQAQITSLKKFQKTADWAVYVLVGNWL